MKKVQILIFKFLISLSIFVFAIMQAEAFMCSCTESMSLRSAKGLMVR
jgi:hypothetical protein